MKCPKCGTEIVRGEKTCWQCYTPLEGAAQGEGPASAVAASPRNARVGARAGSRAPLAIAVILVLVAGGGGYYYWSQYTGPAACARAYCAALQEQDAKALRSVLTSESREYAEMAMMSTGSMPAAGNLRVQFCGVKRSGQTAKARIATSFTMGKGEDAPEMRQTAPIVLVKGSDGWQVDMRKTQELQMRVMEDFMRGFDFGESAPEGFNPEDFKFEAPAPAAGD
ncbi:MAG: zinc ribbon domain-containing protein [Armatimonadota bacterium]|nr:MAG: zinc ribbon domain-containing protein [Armatimonadota bacterium]